MEEALHRVRRALDRKGRPDQGTYRPAGSDYLDVAVLAGHLWRNIWLIAATTMVVLALGGIYAFFVAEVTYRSSASIVLRESVRIPIDAPTGTASGRLPLSEEEINTELEVIVSATNLSAVVSELGLLDDPEFNSFVGSDKEFADPELRDEMYMTATVEALQDAIDAENVDSTSVLRVTVESASPAKTRDIANSVVNQYQVRQYAIEEQRHQADVERLSERLQELQTKLVITEKKIGEFRVNSSDPDQQLRDTVELEKLAAEASTIRELYQRVLGRYSVVSVEEAPQRTASAVLDSATLPINDYKPRRAFILAGSLLAGLFLGVFLALLRETLADRIRSASDLAGRMGRPVISSAARFDKRKRYGGLVRQFGLNDPECQSAMEDLRTSITSISDGRASAPRIISVISATSEEGKSGLALALAVSYADAGARVLLVDGDLRQRTLTTWLSRSKKTGLIAALSGAVDPMSAIEKIPGIGVHFLNCEVSPLKPLDALTSDKFAEKIVGACKNFDVAIFDTAPLLAVSDGRAVSRLADFVLYAASQKRSKTKQLTEVFAEMESVGLTVDAVALSEAEYGLFDRTRKHLRKRYVAGFGGKAAQSTATP